MATTKLHKADMVGEHARCLYMLSVLLKRQGRAAEGEVLLQQAEALYFSRVEGDPEKKPTEKDYDRLVYFRWG